MSLEPELRQVCEDVYAYLQPDGSWYLNNTGFLVSRDGVISVDTTSTERRTRAYLDDNYPDLSIKGLYSPPFRALTPEEETRTIEKINASGAKLVFVVLGCPKQEQWMASMAGKVNAVMIGIGGALPVLIGIQKRAPKWMQNAGLEWLFRLVQEPKRLFKRYAVTNSVFLYLLSRELVKKTFSRKFEPHELN